MKAHQLIAKAARTGDLALLYSALDCDRYTRAGDARSLEGMGWMPCELTEDERRAIEDAIDETESGQEADVE